MEALSSVAIPSDFDPSNTHLIFNIAITDTLLSRVVPLLTARFISEAPLAKLNFHFHSNPGSMAGLERGGLDCAVGMFPSVSPSLIVEGIADDDYVCVFRRNHPLLNEGSRWSSSWRRGISSSSSLSASGHGRRVDESAGNGARDRSHGERVRRCSERRHEQRSVAAVPDLRAQRKSASRLAWAPLPFLHDRILYKMAWHDRTDRNPSTIWLRGIVRGHGETRVRVFITRGEALDEQRPLGWCNSFDQPSAGSTAPRITW